MPLKIVRNDITLMDTDAIVNAANETLLEGGGVCGAIFAAAGREALKRECLKHGRCATGKAVITPGCGLKAKYIIHTPGPVWRGGSHGEEALLKSCYTESLKLAYAHGCESIAFPLISAGIYGYPKEKAYRTAVSVIGEFLETHDMEVFLVLYDTESAAIGEKLHSDIEKFIDDRYVSEHPDIRRNLNKIEMSYILHDSSSLKELPDLSELTIRLEESFTRMLLRLIDESGMTDSEVYKRANIDRRHFSKIRSNEAYSPGKSTVLAFAIALRLSLDQTLDLLGKAGYTLSHSSKTDIIAEYYITKEIYDIYQLNEALFAFGLDTI